MKNDILSWVGVQRGFVCKGSLDIHPGGSGLFVRGNVGGFSSRSRKRLLFFLRNSVAHFRVFATLTYPSNAGTDGKECKRQLKIFLQRLRRNQTMAHGSIAHGSIAPPSIVWFQEWQRNGRLHFHLFCTHFIDKNWLSKCWANVVGSADPAHVKAGTNVKAIKDSREQMCHYAGKYAIKADQKDVPAGWIWPGRFWGISGDRSVVAAATAWKSSAMVDPGVHHSIMELNLVLKSYIEDGSLSPVQPNDGCSGTAVLFTFKDTKILTHLIALVSIVESKQLLVRALPVFDYEETERREAKYQAEVAYQCRQSA